MATLAVLVIGGAIGCQRAVAVAPPMNSPVVSEVRRVGGHPITIAARGARALSDVLFATKRFGSDSTWGYRGAVPGEDAVSIRLRYQMYSSDSTSVLLELWANCVRPRECHRSEIEEIFLRLAKNAEPPQ